MGSGYREIRPQATPRIPQPLSYGYFAEQAHFAGYMGQGPTQPQYFQGDHHQQCPHPHPLLQGDNQQQSNRPHPHPHPFQLPYKRHIHEAIQREIEKEQIREEIIMSKIVRRRELEAEVRRELMMERELALWRCSNGFPFASSSVMGFESPMKLPLMETRAEGRSLEERIVLSLADRDKLNGGRESGGLEHFPFHSGSADVRISQVKPVLEEGKEKERIILLREAAGVDAGKSLSDGNLRKKAKEEWSCALCKVSATSQSGLNEHLQGKKHKLKEATLRAQKAGKNYSIGLLSKKPAKGVEAPGTAGPGTDNEVKFASESSTFSMTGEASSKTDDMPQLQEKSNSENIRKDEEAVVAQKVSKRKNKVKEKSQFWCLLCKVGAPSKKTLKNHVNGKKHKRRLLMSNKNCEVGQSDVKDGNVDELMEENMGGGMDEPVEKTATEDGRDMDGPVEEETMAEDSGAVHKPMGEETMAEDGGPLDEPLKETVGKDDGALYEPVEEAMAEGSMAVHLAKPNDDLPKAEVADEPEDNELLVS